MPNADGFAIRHVTIGRQTLRVGVKRGRHPTPLLIFNGIGANLELLEGVATALPDIEVVVFDVPGVGGSPLPRRPYRLRTLARLADALLTTLGYRGASTSSVCRGAALSLSNSRGRTIIAAAGSCWPRLPPAR